MTRFSHAAAVLFLVTVIGCDSRQPECQWFRTYGTSLDEEGASVHQAADGGFVLAQVDGSQGGFCSLVKTNSTGREVWRKRFGLGWKGTIRGVLQAADGGYVAVGAEHPYSADILTRVWWTKLDSSGNEVHSQTYLGGYHSAGTALGRCSDGGFIIAGGSWYPPLEWLDRRTGTTCVLLIKVDARGRTMWSQGLAFHEWVTISSVAQTTDGGYIMAGSTSDGPAGLPHAGATSGILVKTDSSGELTWTLSYGTTREDALVCVRETRDSSYVAVGWSESPGAAGMDAWLVQTDASGKLLWTRCFGGPRADYFNSVVVTHNGDYVLAGYTCSSGQGAEDAWLVCVDSTGHLLWEQTYGGGADDWFSSLVATSDGGFVATGSTESYGLEGSSDAWLVKVDSVGR